MTPILPWKFHTVSSLRFFTSWVINITIIMLLQDQSVGLCMYVRFSVIVFYSTAEQSRTWTDQVYFDWPIPIQVYFDWPIPIAMRSIIELAR